MASSNQDSSHVSAAVYMLLILAFALTSFVACILKPGSPDKNLHNLSGLILLSGSVETNLGPGSEYRMNPKKLSSLILRTLQNTSSQS